MTPGVRPLVAGNWKMNGMRGSLNEASAIAAQYDWGLRRSIDLLICPPATLIAPMSRQSIGSGLLTGGQDCHANASGAHTGDLSAEMIADAGGSYVIVGHSERRAEIRKPMPLSAPRLKPPVGLGLLPLSASVKPKSSGRRARR